MDLASIIRADLKNNGHKKLLLLGKTGSGKSALCNTLCQNIANRQRVFPETANPVSGNTHTIMTDVNLNGDPNYPISLIDTVGFDSIDDRVSPIANLVHSLKDCCDYINVFGLVINGQSPRMDGSLQEMIRILESMFGRDHFWRNVVVIFSKMEMSNGVIRRRMQSNGVTDEVYCAQFIDEMNTVFQLGTNSVLPYLILDAHCYINANHEEVSTFFTGIGRLYNYLIRSPNCPVESITEVLGRYEGLQAELGRIRKEDRNERIRLVLKCATAAFSAYGIWTSVGPLVAEKIIEKFAEKTTQKVIEKTTEKIIEKTTEKVIEKTAEKAVGLVARQACLRGLNQGAAGLLTSPTSLQNVAKGIGNLAL